MNFTTETGVGYFTDGDGRIVDFYQCSPGEHEAADPRVEAHDVETVGDIQSMEVDDAHRSDVVDPDEAERNAIRQLADTRKNIERLEQEIGEGNIPDRASNANVDVVVSEFEDRIAELRKRIG